MGVQCLTIYMLGFGFFWMYRWVATMAYSASGQQDVTDHVAVLWLQHWYVLLSSTLIMGGFGSILNKSSLLAFGTLGSILNLANEIMYLNQSVGLKSVTGGILPECQVAMFRQANIKYCCTSDGLIVALSIMFTIIFLMYAITIGGATVKAVDVKMPEDTSNLRIMCTVAVPLLLLIGPKGKDKAKLAKTVGDEQKTLPFKV